MKSAEIQSDLIPRNYDKFVLLQQTTYCSQSKIQR